MAKYNHLVLVATICIDDDWYGDRYRYMLSAADGIGFKTKSEARKFVSKLKKYVVDNASDSIKSKDISITINEHESYVDYTHTSRGPSLYYNHIELTTADLSE